MLTRVQVNVYNIAKMRRQEPRPFQAVRLDANNDCNVHCVYCHNRRSNEFIATDELRAFLNENVVSVNVFQVGCGMEPTLDARMCDLLLMVASSRARPINAFHLQTNGILLHKHDYGKMREAGLTRVSISIDAADPATHKLLRGGTSLAKVQSNLLAFHVACPSIELAFMTTVTSMNIHAIEDLVAFGLRLGVKTFVLRQMFYFETSNVVDHSKMPSLLITSDAFAQMKEVIGQKFGRQAQLHFLDAPVLLRMAEKTRADSLF